MVGHKSYKCNHRPDILCSNPLPANLGILPGNTTATAATAGVLYAYTTATAYLLTMSSTPSRSTASTPISILWA